MTSIAITPSESSSHCHLPAEFDPDSQLALRSEVARLIGAAQWLARELDDGRGCHAALLQASVLQADIDAHRCPAGGGPPQDFVTRAIHPVRQLPRSSDC